MDGYKWELFGAVVVIVGFIVTVFKASRYFSMMESATNGLKESINLLREEIKNISEHNSEGHRRIWMHNDEQDDILNNHETRIKIIEQKEGKQ